MSILKAIKAWWKPEAKEIKPRGIGQSYWLCCGTLDAEHSAERSGECLEKRAGRGYHCNFGDSEEQKEHCERLDVLKKNS